MVAETTPVSRLGWLEGYTINQDLAITAPEGKKADKADGEGYAAYKGQTASVWVQCYSDLEFTAGQHVQLPSELLACEFPRDFLQKHPQREDAAQEC